MKCVPTDQGKQLLHEVHAGICGHHAAPCSLVGKAFCQGFYYPTALRKGEEVVCSCEGCQFYARQTDLPAQELQAIPITWPFAVWGLDMVGPLKRAPGGHTHLLVVVDKFTKWIEVKPITNIRSQEAVEFFLDIVYRFGVPNCIIMDNGTNFTKKKFLDFYNGYDIRVDWVSAEHPRTNGHVERANSMVLQGPKSHIFD